MKKSGNVRLDGLEVGSSQAYLKDSAVYLAGWRIIDSAHWCRLAGTSRLAAMATATTAPAIGHHLRRLGASPSAASDRPALSCGAAVSSSGWFIGGVAISALR